MIQRSGSGEQWSDVAAGEHGIVRGPSMNEPKDETVLVEFDKGGHWTPRLAEISWTVPEVCHQDRSVVAVFLLIMSGEG